MTNCHTKGWYAIWFLRWGEQTNEVMVCLILNGKELPHADILIDRLTTAFPQIASIQLNCNTAKTNVILGPVCQVLYGKPTISDVLCGIKVELSPLSFYQVNRSGAEKLYRIAADFASLSGNELLLDLYCGTGTIGLSMAHLVREVIGVEIVKEAVENAKENAQRNNIQNARFLCADAAGRGTDAGRGRIASRCHCAGSSAKGMRCIFVGNHWADGAGSNRHDFLQQRHSGAGRSDSVSKRISSSQIAGRRYVPPYRTY